MRPTLGGGRPARFSDPDRRVPGRPGRQDPALESLSSATEERRPLGIDLLYTDHEGGQRTVSRFAMHPREADDLW
jgi:hypothetical protein